MSSSCNIFSITKNNTNPNISKDLKLMKPDEHTNNYDEFRVDNKKYINSSHHISKITLRIRNEIIIDCFTSKLEKIVNENKDMTREELYEQNRTRFYSPNTPEIDISGVFNKIISLYPNIQYSTIVIIGVYIDRFCRKLEFHLTPNNVIR